ncbi:MAG TPA: RNase H-like domain-containing protein, partial [Candidatus Limnocylindrales bacterium]|nr:RNase H-like domain-containing protein [Candidatus Limnocylindrales bacterium]
MKESNLGSNSNSNSNQTQTDNSPDCKTDINNDNSNNSPQSSNSPEVKRSHFTKPTSKVNAATLVRSKCKAAINLDANFSGHERSYHVLVDTGAEINCITAALVEELKLKIVPYSLDVLPFAGAAVNAKGFVEILIKLFKQEFTLQFIVFDQLDYEVYFGTPACEALDCFPRLAFGYCSILGEQLPLIRLKANWTHTPIRSAKLIKIEPRTHVVIPVQAQIPHSSLNIIEVVPSRALSSTPLRIPNAILSEPHVSLIEISNTCDKVITIKPGALLAYAMPCSEPQEKVYHLISTQDDKAVATPLPPSTFHSDLMDESIDDETVYLPTNTAEYTLEEYHDELPKQINQELKPDQRAELTKMLESFRQLFARNPRSPGVLATTKCRVPLKDPNMVPLRFPPYRLAPKMLEELRRQLAELLENKIIRESRSPWAFPIVMVPKPDGTIRFCTDFSKLTPHVKYDAFPLPRIDDTLDRLAGAKYFTTLDAASGYWQIPVEESDKEILSFITPVGSYSYNVMPMGYCNATGEYQREITTGPLAPFLFYCCLVYVDDSIIFSATYEDHIHDLSNVLTALNDHGWKLKLSKCKFAHTTIDFLGHTVSYNQITVKKDNLEKLLAMKKPTNIKELQSFLGLVNYYRKFIQGFNYILEPILSLLKQDNKWLWTSDHDKAFAEIVSKLACYPILRMPDFNKSFIVKTDASDFAFGAALVQVHDGLEHPVSFHSGSFNSAQRGNSWDTWKREGFSVVTACKKWHHYLANDKFTIVTDHEALLTVLDPTKDTKAIINRWRIYLSQYRYSIQHRPGKFLVLEDSLSRSPSLQAISISDLRSSQSNDSTIQQIIDQISKKKLLELSPEVAELLKQTSKYFAIEDNILYFIKSKSNSDQQIKRLVVPSDKFIEVIPMYHDSPLAGHHSAERTYEKIANDIWMPDLFSKVKKYCSECEVCDRNRSFFKHNAAINPIVASAPMEIIQIDHIGPFTETPRKNQYILSVIDLFTKKKWYVAVSDVKAELTYSQLMLHVFSNFDLPKQILTDQGSSFNQSLAEAFSRLTGINHNYAIADPFHETMGAVERSNRTCEDMLRKYVNQISHADWDLYVHLLAYAENKALSRTHGYSPDYLMFGRP